MNQDIPRYTPHPATIKISGGTNCRNAAKCALFFLNRQVGPHVDFFYIGANAGQQAMKAMGIMRRCLEEATEGKATVVFQPNHVQTLVRDEITGLDAYKVAVYWRAFVVKTQAFDDLIKIHGHSDQITVPEAIPDAP